MPIKRMSKQGVTLVEMLVVILMVSAILGAFYSVLIMNGRYVKYFIENDFEKQEARRAMTVMSNELRHARDILIERTKSSVRLRFLHSELGILSYQWSSSNEDEPMLNYKLLRVHDGDKRALASHLQLVDFDYSQNTSISISLTFTSQDGQLFELKQKVALRLKTPFFNIHRKIT